MTWVWEQVIKGVVWRLITKGVGQSDYRGCGKHHRDRAKIVCVRTYVHVLVYVCERIYVPGVVLDGIEKNYIRKYIVTN